MASNSPHPIPPVKAYCHSSCQICGETAKEPVLNLTCGHLFCWSCIYKVSKESDFGDQCPECSSHMDISRGTDNTTIISVYSGPEPGIYYNPLCDTEPDEEEDELENPKEETSDYTYVPPRPPMWSGGCRYSSVVTVVSAMLYRIHNTVKIHVNPILKFLCEEGVHDFQSVASRVACHMNDALSLVQDSCRWAHVEKIGCGPINPKEGPRDSEPQQHCGHNPQAASFDIDSTFCCKICNAPAYEPVVTRCGHLFCWSCLYLDFHSKLNRTKTVFYCPFCKLFSYASNECFGMNPIYHGRGLSPDKEDELLIRGRRFVYKGKNNINQILCVPRRPPLAVALRFLHHMLDAYVTEQIQIKSWFDRLIDGSSNTKKEYGKHIAMKIEDELNLFYNQLIEEWKKELSESQINICVLEEAKMEHDTSKWLQINKWTVCATSFTCDVEVDSPTRVAMKNSIYCRRAFDIEYGSR